MNRWEGGNTTPNPFDGTIFVLLEYAVTVRTAAEIIRRLESANSEHEELVCMAVWLACPEGPPATLRQSTPELVPVASPSSRREPRLTPSGRSIQGSEFAAPPSPARRCGRASAPSAQQENV